MKWIISRLENQERDIWVGGDKVPFDDDFPKNTLCYKVMTTKPDEAIRKGNTKIKKAM